MCYIQPTNTNLEHIACPKCKKQYVLCPCCGELMELQGQKTYPLYPIPIRPLPVCPTPYPFPACPQQPWQKNWRVGTPYIPAHPFSPMCKS